VTLFTKDKLVLNSSPINIDTDVNQYDLLLNKLCDGTWSWNLQTQEVYCSNSFNKQLGFNDNDIKWNPETFNKYIHPDDRTAVWDKLYLMLNKNDKEYNTIFRMLTKDGTCKHMLSHVTILRDKNYKPYNLFGSITDITEFKLLERELQVSKERYDNLLKAMSDGIFDWDIVKNKAWCSFKLKKYFTPDENDELSLEGFINQIYKDDQNEVRSFLSGIIESDKEHYKFHFRVRRNNKIYWLLSSGQVLRDNNSKAFRIIGAITDITELKNQKENLSKLEERHNLALKAISDGIFDWDLRTNKVFRSPKVYEIFGVPEEEYQNAPPLDLLTKFSEEKDKGDIKEILKNAIESNNSEVDVELCIPNDASSKWMYIKALILRDENNIPYRIIGGLKDITKQKQLEEELRVARIKAERASEAKTEFLANMSHEIRTPLNAIMGLTHVLSHTSPLSLIQTKYINTIINSAENLLNVINKILDLTKIESNVLELHENQFNLPKLLQDLIDLFSQKTNDKGINIILKYPEDAPKILVADEIHLRQILLNLIENAIKFTENGFIRINTKFINNQLKIRIIDTGIGIANNQIYTVFDKFTQADNTIKRKYGGTGLGLSICTKLVQLMKGRIRIKSTIGKGTAFFIELPIKIGNENNNKALNDLLINNPANIQPNHPILVVEDNKENALVVEAVLNMLGYSYKLVNQGSEAIKLFLAEEFSLILMDIQMENMDGFEVSKYIREIEKERDSKYKIPIIALTAHAFSGYYEKCLSNGMDDYLAKPFTPELLHSKIKSFLHWNNRNVA
jgi:PAS domain S-box-containing protein